MSKDEQYVKSMIEQYKKQQLDQQINKQKNKQMTHPSTPSLPSSPMIIQTPRYIPQLMDQPVNLDDIQRIHHQNNRVKTSIDHRTTEINAMSGLNQKSSTPRRALDDSVSDNYSQRQAKRSRAHINTPPQNRIAASPIPVPPVQSKHLPINHLQRAVSNNLPCFYISFEINSTTTNGMIPTITQTANWIRQLVNEQSNESLDKFSVFIPAGNNRYKVGVGSKNEFLLLWNCKWPEKMGNIKVEISRPRSLPDCCALVVRYVPTDLSISFIYQEISKTIRSAVSISKINYHRPRSTNDYRFCVVDRKEFDEIIAIGRIAIGHSLLPITPFITGLKMTYCANCWKIGHLKSECKESPRCRKCLDKWDRAHQCNKPLTCAQCQDAHGSLSGECQTIKNYRQTLKIEVNKAMQEGRIQPIGYDKATKIDRKEGDTFKPNNNKVIQNNAWNQPHQPFNIQNTDQNTQINEVTGKINAILDINHRLESKMDNHSIQNASIEKKVQLNKEFLLSLANIVHQLISAGLEKKNKHLLQNLTRQIEQLKIDLTDKYNETVTIQQSADIGTPASPVLKMDISNKQSTTTTLSTSTTETVKNNVNKSSNGDNNGELDPILSSNNGQ
ncbi:unnamed protein product [Rotaria magnacalcarata]|uniref:Gag-like protein n=3 Tax=Rotaria TaxID=231623 RepID=A0A816NCF0_9BILA|nr:unnamed protein product [Rotaria magnacalcarata]CAF2154595.1 unnamed protein product [Rotaria magnacalcarata]CAF4271678.1 unnamed protein product [Rotaria magnacalcarata]CAF4731013.1 unnamed protein product [Rotaria magnacalcarata]